MIKVAKDANVTAIFMKILMANAVHAPLDALPVHLQMYAPSAPRIMQDNFRMVNVCACKNMRKFQGKTNATRRQTS